MKHLTHNRAANRPLEVSLVDLNLVGEVKYFEDVLV